jgi:hypothetical protein
MIDNGHGPKLKKSIISTYPTRPIADKAETALIKEAKHDPKCMNGFRYDIASDILDDIRQMIDFARA